MRRACKVRHRYSQSKAASPLAISQPQTSNASDQFWSYLDLHTSFLNGFPSSTSVSGFSDEGLYSTTSKAFYNLFKSGQSSTRKRSSDGTEVDTQDNCFPVISTMQLHDFSSASSAIASDTPLTDDSATQPVHTAPAVSYNGPAIETNPSHCMARACRTLSTLYSAARCSFISSDTNSHQVIPQAIDGTLNSTNTAKLTMEQVLSCNCAHHWDTYCILLLIAQQAIERCATLAADLAPASTGMTITNANSTQPDGKALPQLLDIPLLIGSHVLDTDTRIRVMIQVLRSELDAISRVVERLISCNVTVQKEEEMLKVFQASLQEKLALARESFTV